MGRTMRAIRIEKPGGPDVLQAVTLPIPEPREGEVLLRVVAAGVNRPDVLQRLGKYPVPPDADPLPGLEVSGEVVATGTDVSRWSPGDRVMALTHGGGYAEYCRVHATHCLPVPESLSMIEAAAVPETYFTVHYNLFMRAHLAEGETVLVHGGSSGIGTTAIQLAKAAGARVIVTAGSDEKCGFCGELGADYAINYKRGDWFEEARRITDHQGVDVVLDIVGAPYASQNLDLLRRDGRYVIIAFLKGSVAELDLRTVLSRRLTITGSTLRPQTVKEKAAIATSLETAVLPLLADGSVRPVIHETFPLEDAARAHELMESSRHMGKIVLVARPS
jgi:putative PIG3 family NAD(P)H quinone oxidoreductase